MPVLDRTVWDFERDPAVRAVSSRGLCTACSKDPTCTYTRLRPVIQCEEFEGFGPRKKGAEMLDCAEESGSQHHPAPREYKGLCTSCSYRETCAFPRPAGGIWHCEEFR